MKSTGVVRKIDPLGRLVIPMEIRKTLRIDVSDPIEIFVDGELVILKKYNPQGACAITGEVLEENTEYAPGLILSPDGASQLLALIEAKQTKTSN